MSDNQNDIWGSFKGALRACEEVCGYNKNRKCNVNTGWWNSGLREEIQQQQVAYEEMTKNPNDETKNEYGRLIKVAKKTVVKAMKEEAVRKVNELGRKPNNVLRFVKKK